MPCKQNVLLLCKGNFLRATAHKPAVLSSNLLMLVRLSYNSAEGLYHSNKSGNSIHLKISFAEVKYCVTDMKQRIIPLWQVSLIEHFNSEGKCLIKQICI